MTAPGDPLVEARNRVLAEALTYGSECVRHGSTFGSRLEALRYVEAALDALVALQSRTPTPAQMVEQSLDEVDAIDHDDDALQTVGVYKLVTRIGRQGHQAHGRPMTPDPLVGAARRSLDWLQHRAAHIETCGDCRREAAALAARGRGEKAEYCYTVQARDDAAKLAALRARVEALERETFDYGQREKAWNESKALDDYLACQQREKALAARVEALERERDEPRGIPATPCLACEETWPARLADAKAELNERIRTLERDVERLRAALEAVDEAADFAYGALRDAVADMLDKPAGYAVIRMIQDARRQARAALAPEGRDEPPAPDSRPSISNPGA